MACRSQRRVVDACPRYEVSDDGRVFDARRDRELPQWKNWRGYPMVNLRHEDGSQRHYSVHRLVATAFLPKASGKSEVNHLDGVKSNNRASNLEWVTRSENQLHAYATGLRARPKGVDHPNSLLDETCIQWIRYWLSSGFPQRAIAAQFGISQTAVSNISTGRRWPHVANDGTDCPAFKPSEGE